MALGLNEAIIAEDAGELLAPPPTVKLVNAGSGRAPTVWWSERKRLFEVLAASRAKDEGLSEYCIQEVTPQNFVKDVPN